MNKRKLRELAGNNSLRVLGSRDSFLCVDLQPPTDLDALCELASENVKIFLNLRRLAQGFNRYSESAGLLHTKFLISQNRNNQIELWIGSHNWTEFALAGINIEASIAIHMDTNSRLYYQARQFINTIRSYCEPFNEHNIEYYKKLQEHLYKTETGETIIELEGNNVNHLIGKVIRILGTETSDFKSVSKVGRNVKLSIHDSNNESQKYLYECNIIKSGLLKRTNPNADEISLEGKHRYAFTERKIFPFLKSKENIPRETLEKAKFFVSIEILRLNHKNYSLYEPKEKKINLWEKNLADPFLKRIKKRILIKNKDIRLCILSPADPDKVVTDEYKSQLLLLPEATLFQKRQTKDYKLISRKIVKVEE
ncbi:MAG: hypothetical protein JW776_02385 [Candidatus Lokiarchaeota archaeon]|nr:hypothetical protein [Candidatus Lokiarchaeota archaeon]